MGFQLIDSKQTPATDLHSPRHKSCVCPAKEGSPGCRVHSGRTLNVDQPSLRDVGYCVSKTGLRVQGLHGTPPSRLMSISRSAEAICSIASSLKIRNLPATPDGSMPRVRIA